MGPQVILNSSISLDGRVDETGQVLSNRLNDYRIELLRKEADAIITTSAYVNHANPTFPCADPDKRLKIFIIDKLGETNPKVDLVSNASFDVSLVVPANVIRARVAALQKSKPNMKVVYIGDKGVDMEELLRKLSKDGVRSVVLEADYQTNMKMLNFRLVDDLYVLVSPVILGNRRDFFDGVLDSNINLELDGITQYGDYVLLHYKVH